jgi:hypothetical protein
LFTYHVCFELLEPHPIWCSCVYSCAFLLASTAGWLLLCCEESCFVT